MKHLFTAALAIFLCASYAMSQSNNNKNDKDTMEIANEWDKIFPLSDSVSHRKVTFKTGFGNSLVADLYQPKNAEGKLPAIAVAGPFGASKEQSSGLYAHEMAKRGFLTIAFDPSYTGESSGEPRRTASPDINTDDFLSAVDYLTTLPNVDAGRIGIIGICGWGGIALNAAAIDTRIKATLASTMYDMSRVNGNGYFDADDSEEKRYEVRRAMSEERTKVAKDGGKVISGGGLPDEMADDAPQFFKDYFDFYKTKRGYHSRSGNSNEGWHTFGCQAYHNARFLYYINEIRSAVLVMHGSEAHSRYFGESAYHYMVEGKAEGYNFISKPNRRTKQEQSQAGLSYALQEGGRPKVNPVPENKELLIIPGATHCDLYDGGYTELRGKGESKHLIPWEKLVTFFSDNLK